MVASSSMRTCNAQTAHVYGKFKLLDGESFLPSPDTNYVRAPTTQAVKQKINSVLRKLPIILYDQIVLGQFWGAIGDRDTFLLTTTCQPAVVYGNNQELDSYYKACLQRKLYVHVYADPHKKPVAVGLPGRIYVTCRPEWSKNMHDYPGDHQHPGQDAIFNKDWRSYGVPLFVDDQCIGVLQFVTDELKDSYDDDIDRVRRALEDAGLQTSTQIERPQKTTDVVFTEGIRKTKSVAFTNYHSIVQLLGLSKRDAADKLGLTESTFGNVRKRVGIPKWLCLPKATWTASFPHENQINQTALSEEDTFDIRDFMEDISDLMNQGNEASGMDQDTDMADALYCYNEWNNYNKVWVNPMSTLFGSVEASSLDASEGISDISELTDYVYTDSPEWSPEETTIVRPSGSDTLKDISNLSEFIIKADSPKLSPEQTNIARVSPPETQKNYHVALDEDWIQIERERSDFMQEFIDDLIDQSNEAPNGRRY